MQVISINVSKSKNVKYNGKTISTGIFKTPLNGKVVINKENMDGDEQADLLNHGGIHKAVYAFSYDHYDYWRDTLETPNLKPGAFGENLTISSFNESEVYIGDQFSIGECVLQVSQPRVPCFKLGIALNNSKAPKLLTKSYRTDVYFRVIKKGAIEAGQNVEKFNELPDLVSIETLFRAYFDKDYVDAHDVFEKALLIQELVPEWQKALTQRISKS